MNKSLHNEITTFFSSLPRQGVGSPHSTIQALDYIPQIEKAIEIVDMGCGTGGQTIELLNHSSGFITAVDSSQALLNKLRINAENCGFSRRLKTVNADMNTITFPTGSIDLIWSEGAIYSIGFKNGLTKWSSFLKPGGCIAVNDCNWLTETPSANSKIFWNDAYPKMTTIKETTKIAEDVGFTVKKTFLQPESDWWDLYYTPMKELISSYKEIDNKQLPEGFSQFLNSMNDEIALRTDHWADYNYVFYILQKNSS